MAKRKVKKRVPTKKAARKKVKKKTSSRSGKLSDRDKTTLGRLEKLADQVVAEAKRLKEPHLNVPSRTLSNVNYSPRKRIIELGKNTNRRELFNLNQAKAYMQTMLVASGCKGLIEEGTTSAIRDLYYSLKHTIPGTKENTFDDQSESDPIIEDLEVLLNSLREELHLYAEFKGAIVGDIVIRDSSTTRTVDLDCSTNGMGGQGIPSIVEPDVFEFRKCGAKFVLHVEKATVWTRFNADDFWYKHNCLLTHGGGQPPRGVRRLLYRLHHELKLPIYVLADNDPWGYYIYSVIKQGSINLAFESQRMAIPAAKFLGVRSIDMDRCGLDPSRAAIALTDSDRKRAKQIAKYPWFEKKKAWQKEIDRMLKNDYKIEVEGLSTKGLHYVTEEYVPERLKKKDWLD